MLNATNETSVTVCFDMMQNLSLPKTPIGQVYYSRQLSMYVFGVVVHHIHLYVWQENKNRKDCNMVASAINDCLRHYLPMLHDAGSLRLFSDSCFGQNKNMNMLAILFALRKQCFPSLNIKYVFLVRGHSYLPAGSFKYLDYKEHLQRLKLPTLAYRRLRGDMTELYKILTGKSMHRFHLV